MKNNFYNNFKFIIEGLSSKKGRPLTSNEIREMLGISSRMTIYGWRSGRHLPNRNTISLICNAIKNELGWDIQPESLIKDDIKEKYNLFIKDMDEIRNEFEFNRVEIISDSDIEANMKKIGNRLKFLRKFRGWSLQETSKKIQERFPEQKEYHLSFTHLSYIERGNRYNISFEKLLSLASVYETSVQDIFLGKGFWKFKLYKSTGDLIIPLSTKFLNSKSDKDLKKFILKIIKIIEILEPSAISKHTKLKLQGNI